jgi:hypothetical protein
MLMAPSRFRELLHKECEHTLTPEEAAEFAALLDDFKAKARPLYIACPVCNGGVTYSPRERATPWLCGQCGALLQEDASDITMHDWHEIDPTIEPMQLLGAFSLLVAGPGTVPCLRCGTAYPKNYSCCPELFLSALELFHSEMPSRRQAALDFLDTHSATLLNSLRGGFAKLFERHHCLSLRAAANKLSCGRELKLVLDYLPENPRLGSNGGYFAAIPSTFQDAILDSFRANKRLADGAVVQVPDEKLHVALDEHTNSIATIMKHVAGNLLSRWTDFLTTDGEKPDRDRDAEFVDTFRSRQELLDYWEQGWACLLAELNSLRPDDFTQSVMIRGMPHTLPLAIARSLGHTCYHVGQIVQLARHHAGDNWKTLTIPRGGSEQFNREHWGV